MPSAMSAVSPSSSTPMKAIGNMVGNNTPVFFVRDPYKFGDFIHTQKRDPKTNMRSNTTIWDFWSLSPESLHQVTILDERPRPAPKLTALSTATAAIPTASSTLKMSASGSSSTSRPCKASRPGRTRKRAAHSSAATAKARSATSLKPLKKAISPSGASAFRSCRKKKPKPTTSIPSTSPKSGPTAIIPWSKSASWSLNRNPENYFADIEQAAFEPSNIVPGISFSPDKMLQARIMSYADAHRYRIGVNYAALPANKPQCPVHTYHRDGNLRFDGNYGGAVNYEPNSMGGPRRRPAFQRAAAQSFRRCRPLRPSRRAMTITTQPGNLFRLMSDGAEGATLQRTLPRR